MKKLVLNNLTAEEIENVMVGNFGNEGDVLRISKEDIEEEGESLSRVYKIEDCFVIVTVNFDTYERRVNYVIELDDAEKVATDNLLTV
ncbi:MAG: hypothetical protein Unbinned5350contig1001_37 [Prokaryotic dsDNA virus sp.]|nr:MAG: hypothetical protein Unbinned5350contig1001_37 [Prokaryotic dsDNA virus sp.]|tara:strand:- start:13969 stop:14232 length:264 start_codon:yes stop_codon:yes gene_type:complete